MTGKQVIAVDLGAESGRVMQATLQRDRVELQEIHRFPNVPVQLRDALHWDILRLWQEIQEGIKKSGADVSSIGVDTWGIDFGLLDRNGSLLANPVHYRDKRTDGMMEWVFDRVPRRAIFERTGIQFMPINTLYQLASLAACNSPLLEAGATLLTIPDLINYWLTGEKYGEFTFATTTQCYNPRNGGWDNETLKAIGVPTEWFPPIIQPGTRIGDYHKIPVIAPATHDTGSAVVAVPTTTPNFAYLSSGTWSLIGLEVNEPVINDDAYAANVTNEGGVAGTFRLLKNVMGLWLIQQCQATWQAQGVTYSYERLMSLAAEAEPFAALIDPDDPSFLAPGDMPTRIRAFCQKTHQSIPRTEGQILRTVCESLALKYRYVLDKMLALTGRYIERLHIIGGGTQNTLLCQMTADAVGHLVITGPIEATALGNAIVQYIALGELEDIAQARHLLSMSLDTRVYEPTAMVVWEEQYQRFKELLG